MKPFFHRLSVRKQHEALTSSMTVREFMEAFRQPRWCNYPEALEGVLGCWSLIIPGRIRRQQDCVNCDERKGGKNAGKEETKRQAAGEKEGV